MEALLTDLIRDIDALDAKQQRMLLDRLTFMQRQAAKQETFSTVELDVWDALCRASGEHRGLASMLDDNRRTRSKYAKDAQAACDYLVAGCREAPAHPQLLSLLAIAADCLGSYVRDEHDGALSLRFMMDALPNIGQAFERGYPGYRKNRHFGQLVTFADPEARQSERVLQHVD